MACLFSVCFCELDYTLSLSQRREYSFYRQPSKNLLRCEIEKASPMAGLWGNTPPFSVGYMKTPPIVPLGGVLTIKLWACYALSNSL